MTDLVRAEQVGLLNIETGEILEPTPENAAIALIALRNTRERINDLTAETTAWLVSEAERQGTKTFHVNDGMTVTLNGGVSEEYDPQDLMELLRSAGCPEDRIEAAVVAEITYKVNRSVLRQLKVNPDYRAAIELARREVEKPYRAQVKGRKA